MAKEVNWRRPSNIVNSSFQILGLFPTINGDQILFCSNAADLFHFVNLPVNVKDFEDRKDIYDEGNNYNSCPVALLMFHAPRIA